MVSAPAVGKINFRTEAENPNFAKKGTPVCPWTPQKTKGIKPLLTDCTECLPDERKTLFGNWRKEESDNKKGARRTKGADNQSNMESSVLFTATLGGFFKENICADNGADANIMGKQKLDKIAAAGDEF